MSQRFRDMSGKELFAIYWPFSSLLIVGILGRWLYPENWVAVGLARALFDACAIAGLLAIVFEVSAEQRLIQRVSDELADKLIGRGLPRGLQEKISEIVKTAIVREQHVKHYRLSDPSPDGNIVLEIGYEYHVKNYSNVPQPYAPYLGDERFYKPEFVSLVYRLKQTGTPDTVYSFDAITIQPLVEPDGTTQALKVVGPEEVVIQPVRDDPEARCEVAWSYRLTMRDEYSDITSFAAPSIGLVIHLDRCPETHEFDVSGPNISAAGNHRYWTSNDSFLQGQHIRARWFRRH